MHQVAAQLHNVLKALIIDGCPIVLCHGGQGGQMVLFRAEGSSPMSTNIWVAGILALEKLILFH